MANTTVSAANRAIEFQRKYHAEYIRSNRFKRYMGSSENSIICVKEDLTKKKGDTINIPLVGALPMTEYNTGSTTLVGNEKALPNEGHRVTVGVVRDATVVNVEEEQASSIDIYNAGKTALKDLQMRYLRNDTINAFNSKNGENYADASEAVKDQWLAANSDRVLFGADVGNTVAGDHSASLLNVDAASDRLTGDTIDKAKFLAQNATVANGDGIRPFKYSEDFESYVLFCNSFDFRDFRNWLTSTGNLKDAMERGRNNPLFAGPESFEWNGVMIRHVPEIGTIGGGNAGIDVNPSFLCGTQALAAVWAQRTKLTIRKEDDYGFQRGVGFMEMRKIDKCQYAQGTANAVDWGMVTMYNAAVANS